MSAPTVSEALLTRLREWGVERVYGYPGDGSNGLNLAFHAEDTPDFIQTRHEALAAFGFARALLKGDPESGRLIRQSIKGKLTEALTR